MLKVPNSIPGILIFNSFKKVFLKLGRHNLMTHKSMWFQKKTSFLRLIVKCTYCTYYNNKI